MTRRQAAVALAALLVVVVVLILVAKWRSPRAETAERVVEGDRLIVQTEGDSGRLVLYFPGDAGWLVAEERTVAAEEGPADLRRIAVEVLEGPTSPGLYAPFPAETEVGSVFVSEDGIAYVDLVSIQADPPRSGSRQEMLSVFSLINSLHANLPELAGVVLLWNGQQRPTFAGHLDTGRPLADNPDLVARSSRPAPPASIPAAPTDPSRP